MAQLKSVGVMQKEIESAIEKGDMVALGQLAMEYAKGIGALGSEFGYTDSDSVYDISPRDNSSEVERLKNLYRERFGGYGGEEMGNGRDLSEDIQQEDDGSIVEMPQAEGNYIPDNGDARVEEKDIFEED